MKPSALFVLFLLSWPGEAFEVVFDGVLVDRANKWDSYPVHLFVDGTHRLWWCSTSSVSGSVDSLTDGIYFSERSGELAPGSWRAPLEVLNSTQTALATNHVCDPAVVLGDFQYNSVQYSHLLLYTYDDAVPPGGDNGSEAAAFSNDGVSWIAATAPAVVPDYPFDGSYGAGQGSLGWGPNLGILNHLYSDTTHPTHPWEARYKRSTDGVTFEPTPSLANPWVDGIAGLDIGADPAVVYSPFHGRWFGAARTVDDEFDGEIILIATEGNGIEGPWSEVGRFNHLLTGVEFNNNPEFGRKADSTLLIDEDGYSFILFGAWPAGSPLQGKVYLVRVKLDEQLPRLGDSFRHIGVTRGPWTALGGTQSELAARPWASSGTVVFGSSPGYVTNSIPSGSHVAGLPFSLSEVPGEPVSVEADVRYLTGGWVAIGLAASEVAGLFSAGGVWALINNTPTPQVEVYGNGLNQLVVAPLPIPDADFDHLRLDYDPSANEISVRANGVPIVVSEQLNFTPTIGAASLHIASPEGGGPLDQLRAANFLVNNPRLLLYRDGFETGGLSRWSSACVSGCEE